jgi:putative ABC transport system permease protein
VLYTTLRGILEAARNISLAVSIVLLGVGGITLIISGIGIMNVMLVTVTQRTREIGVRKAIGAARREILYQFLLEAVILSGSGALVGILIGTSIPFIIRPLIPGGLSIRISRISIVTAFVVSCMTGVIFGYLPARRAAKLQPTEALQHE